MQEHQMAHDIRSAREELARIGAEIAQGLQVLAMTAEANAAKLDTIIGILKKFEERTQPDEEQPILIDESMGSCPQCDCPKVDLSDDTGVVIYTCQACHTRWKNAD